MFLRAFPLALFLLCFIPPARAQEERLRLDELIPEVLESNPEILAAQNSCRAARQRPSQESSLPDPVLTPGYASTGQPWPVSGLGTSVTSHIGATLSQEFLSPGKRKLLGEIAEKEAEAECQNYEMVRLSVIGRLKAAYHRLQFVYAVMDLLTRNRDLLSSLRRRTEAPYFAGQSAQQAQISILENRLLRLEQEKRTQEAEINRLRKRSPDSPLARPSDTSVPTLEVTLDELMTQSRGQAPLLRREQRMVERNEFSLTLAQKQFYPDYEISAGYFSMGRLPDLYEVRVGVRLPVYFSRKQARGVSEQGYRLVKARGNYEAACQDLLFEIKKEHLSAQTATQLIATYSQTVIPQTSQALESYLSAYEAGMVDFMSVQASFMGALDAEVGYHEQILELHLALARLAELGGFSSDWSGERIAKEVGQHENPQTN